jgi:hypothetical protein
MRIVFLNRVNAFRDSLSYSTDQPALTLWKYFTNGTCQVTNDPNEPCTLGYYGVYVINATKREHIKSGIDFAREKNLRLVIRNTGHDFVGRSNGWGSFVINTHNFQEISFTKSYNDSGSYKGGAVTIAAGVQGRKLLKAGSEQSPPVAIVTGECPVSMLYFGRG